MLLNRNVYINLKYIEYCSIFIIKVLSDINTCTVQFMKNSESVFFLELQRAMSAQKKDICLSAAC